MNVLKDRYYTVEEYFSILESSDEKLEYHDGKIYAMAGGQPKHNRISANLIRVIGNEILDKDCSVYTPDQQISIPNENRYVYPDVSVICGEDEPDEKFPTSLKNPILVVEVLSRSTETFDRYEKFSLYRNIPSFKEYLIVHPKRVFIESFYRENPKSWTISSAHKIEDSIPLFSLGISIQVKDIYHRVKDLEK